MMTKNKKKRQKARRSAKAANPIKASFDWGGLIILFVIGGLFTWSFMHRGASPIMGLSLGLFITLAALPYFNPEKWKKRPFTCALFGAVFGGSVAISRGAGVEMIIVAVLIGAVVGFFATSWIPYINP
ncbi:hypothetical protein [Kordiimonas sediminis]|nr:hypothetical protein [Kordiimonas sediminis]